MQSFFDLFARYLADKAKSQELYVSPFIYTIPNEAPVQRLNLRH